MMSEPKVSVLMTVYNEEETVLLTVESVLGQTFKYFEYVIYDDGSKDRTLEILHELEKKDKRIKVYSGGKNLGVARAVSAAAQKCAGEYIAVIDAGDLCNPARLEKQAGFLDKNPDVYIVGCYHHWIDRRGNIINSYEFPTDVKKLKGHIFGFGAVAAHPCLMIRKSLFDKTGSYDSSLKTSMDYELYLRTLSLGFYISNVPEYLVLVLRRGEGISLSKNKQIFRDMFRLRLRYLPGMFSLKNCLYTFLSFFLILAPGSLLKKVVTSSVWSKKLRKVAIKV